MMNSAMTLPAGETLRLSGVILLRIQVTVPAVAVLTDRREGTTSAQTGKVFGLRNTALL